MKGSLYSSLLVIIHVAAMAYLLVAGLLIEPYGVLPLVLVIAGAAVGFWGVIEMRKHKFSILPEVPVSATLVTTGPYRYIRNPMYTGLILAGSGVVFNSGRSDTLIAYLVLVAVLLLKISREEKFLSRSFKDYPAYVKRSFKLIPFIY